MAFSHSLLQLLIGRFTVGFAVSLSAMAECLYISEISAPSNRGLLISLNELGITVGLLLAYITNFIFMSVSGGWRYMFGLSTVLSVVQFGALLLLPSTPHFLVMKSRDSEACVQFWRGWAVALGCVNSWPTSEQAGWRWRRAPARPSLGPRTTCEADFSSDSAWFFSNRSLANQTSFTTPQTSLRLLASAAPPWPLLPQLGWVWSRWEPQLFPSA